MDNKEFSTTIEFEIPFGDQPNANGRVYSKEVVEKITKEINEKPFLILPHSTNFINNPSISDTVGYTVSAINNVEKNSISITAKVQNFVKTALENVYNIVPNGIGNYEDENGEGKKVVRDYELKYLSITDDSSFKNKGE